MPRKPSKMKEMALKTNLQADIEAKRQILSKLKNELLAKKTHLEKVIEEEKDLKQKIDEIAENVKKQVITRQLIDERVNNKFPPKHNESTLNELRLMSIFSCIRWDFKNDDKNVIRGYLSEKHQFKAFDFNKGDRSWFTVSDELWSMMDYD